MSLFSGDEAGAAGPALFDDLTAPATPYRVLARKYRPTRFEDLIGQEVMVRTLRNAFATGRIAHAFMLTGVRGVGKTTTARIIARALNCIGADGQGGPTADPCGVCHNCISILADRHPDVMEMDAASRTGVDDVREIIEATKFRPMQARSKVFIIDEVHMLSRNAFNALLKTLEEPPPHVKFIFATTEIRKVPVTVLSRCQRFDLRRISAEELATRFLQIAGLEKVTIARDAVDLIARAADGSARDGLSLLDQAIAQNDGGAIEGADVAAMLGLADRQAIFDLFEAVIGGQPDKALAITDHAYQYGADLGAILGDLLALIHTLSRLKAVPSLRESQELPEAERQRGAALADRLSVPVLGRAWQMLLKGVQEVETAADRRAAAEMVLIRLCHVSELPTPGDLVRKLQSAPADIASVRASAPPPTGGTTTQQEPRNFRDLVALVEAQREAMLCAHLRHGVHLVKLAPPVLEIRPQADVPRDLAARLGKLLSDITGTRWTIALSSEVGEPTLADQDRAAADKDLAAATAHPLVQAVLAQFPGARIMGLRQQTETMLGGVSEPISDMGGESGSDSEEWSEEWEESLYG